MQAEYFALEGITELMQTLDQVAQAFNPTLALEGVLLTMYDDRTNLSQQVTENLQAFFGEKLLATTIPRNIRLAEAPSHGKPIQLYDRGQRARRRTPRWRSNCCAGMELLVRRCKGNRMMEIKVYTQFPGSGPIQSSLRGRRFVSTQLSAMSDERKTQRRKRFIRWNQLQPTLS